MNLSQEIQTLQERLERRGGLNGGGPEEAAAAAASLYRLVAAHPSGGGLTLMARELQAAWARDILTVRKAGGGHIGGGGLQEKKMYNIECNPKLCASESLPAFLFSGNLLGFCPSVSGIGRWGGGG
jgi:hypothetical protein